MRHEVGGDSVSCGGGATGALALAAALAPAARACGVRHAPGATALVAVCGSPLRLQTSGARTGAAAIALAAIAAAAKQHLRAATRTHEQAGGMVDQLTGSSGRFPRRPPASCRKRHYTGGASASSARCRARRAVMKLPGQWPPPCPPTSRARPEFYRTCNPLRFLATTARLRLAGRPAGRPARRSQSPRTIKTKAPPRHRSAKRRLITIRQEMPSHRRISALPDRRSQKSGARLKMSRGVIGLNALR